jgi:ATP-dependent RNA/DNA helicase IGHMBP2
VTSSLSARRNALCDGMKPGGRLAARKALKEQQAQPDNVFEATPGSSSSLVFPASLSAAQRARLHETAEGAGLAHASTGEGSARVLTLGSGPPLVLTADDVSDDLIAHWVQHHLGITCNTPVKKDTQPVKQASAGGVSVEAFVATTSRLLELERAAELASGEAVLAAGVEAAVALGVCVRNLRVTDASPGFLGRTVLTFTLRGQSDVPLPDHKLGVHDVVAIRPSSGAANEAPLARGIVSRLTDAQLSVALDDAPEGPLCEGAMRVERLTNDVTHTRLKGALTALQAAHAGSGSPAPGARLVGLLFGRSAPLHVVSPPPLKPMNGDLDASQAQAVAFALNAPELALIWGPPGTGKTTALVELVLQAVRRGERVLACAASNVAVDNLVERLRAASPKLRCVRLGHPARLAPAVVDACLDACVAKADSSALAADVRRERKALTARLLKLGRRDASERRDVRRQLGQLAKEERQRTQAAVGEVLDAAQVTAATLTGAMGRTLTQRAGGRPSFDMVVIDEAAQALEVACWGPLLLGRKAVLAGDHMQLPPTVLSDAAAAEGLSATLFERAHRAHPSLCRMLTVQYRMNAAIADWASGELYDHQLTAPPAVATRTLGDLCAGAAELPVLLHIDTAGCDMEEDEDAGASAESKCNPGEADVAVAHVRRLLAAGLVATQIGVISPYSAQVQLLRELRSGDHRLTGVEISTVDGFQGREMEALVISCVRSNPAGNIGFLADVRRMNVAITRARRHCAVIGDSETLRGNPFLGRLCDWLEAHGEVRSAAEYT